MEPKFWYGGLLEVASVVNSGGSAADREEDVVVDIGKGDSGSEKVHLIIAWVELGCLAAAFNSGVWKQSKSFNGQQRLKMVIIAVYYYYLNIKYLKYTKKKKKNV